MKLYGLGHAGFAVLASWLLWASPSVADFGTVDVLNPYSDRIVVEQGDEFWLTCSSNPAVSDLTVDIGTKSYGVPIKPGDKVSVMFEDPGEYPIVLYVSGYPERTFTVQVLSKTLKPVLEEGAGKMAAVAVSSTSVSMGSLYAGYYTDACGSTGHKWPFRLVASAACTVELRIMSGGSGAAWSGPVVAGDNIIVVNNPTGDQWVLSPFVGDTKVGGTQTLNINTPYRLGIDNVKLTTNTFSHSVGDLLAGSETYASTNRPVTWEVVPNCWWTLTNACADLFLWSGTGLAASGLTNGATYTTPGDYQVKVCCNTDTAGKEVTVHAMGLIILSLSPAAELLLGDDLTVSYQIIGPASFVFDTVDLEVRNSADTLVFKKTGLNTGVGTHTATWDDAKWNQSPHSGAYANPNNSDYKIKVIAKKGSDVSSDEETIKTRLVIEADIKDEKAGSASRSAGLADLADALDVVLTKGTTVHTFSGAALTLTDIIDGKHLKVDNSTLNSLADGTWTTQFKDVRDEIGNFYDADPVTSSIEHYKWDMDLY